MTRVIFLPVLALIAPRCFLCPPFGEDPDTAGPSCSFDGDDTGGNSISEGGSVCSALATFTGHPYVEVDEPGSSIWIGSGAVPSLNPTFSQNGVFTGWLWSIAASDGSPALLSAVDGTLAVKIPESYGEIVWIHLENEPTAGDLVQFGGGASGMALKHELEDGSWVLAAPNTKGATDLAWSIEGTSVRGRVKDSLSTMAGAAVSNMERTSGNSVGFWPSWGGCGYEAPALDETG